MPRNASGRPVSTVGNRDEYCDGVRNAVWTNYSAYRGDASALDRSVVRSAESARFVDGWRQVRVVTWWQHAGNLLAAGLDDDGVVNEHRPRCLIKQGEGVGQNVMLECCVAGVTQGSTKRELAMQRAWRGDLDGHLAD